MNCFKYKICFKLFILPFLLIHKDSNLDYKNENTEKKLLKIMRTNQLFKVKNSILELEKDFIVMEVKLKREV